MPTELNALTKRAAGALLQPLHQRLVARVKYASTPLSGGASAIGFVVSITILPARFADAGLPQRLGGGRALDGEHHELPGRRGIGNAADPRLLIPGMPVAQLVRMTGAEHDIVPVLQESAGQRLRHRPRTDDANLHDDIRREPAGTGSSRYAGCAPASSRSAPAAVLAFGESLDAHLAIECRNVIRPSRRHNSAVHDNLLVDPLPPPPPPQPRTTPASTSVHGP